MPGVTLAARANRAFLRRAVRWLLAQGVRQFVDIGVRYPGGR
ncbi:SAM-dependent methyltransferase [Catenuloplanes nepalensis]